MFSLSNKLYNKIREDEVARAGNMLKMIKIDAIFDNIARNCWRYGLQYVTQIKNSEILTIKIHGINEVMLLKFHKIDIVTIEDYMAFIAMIDLKRPMKGVYIATGKFEDSILREQNNSFSFKNSVRIEDGKTFIRKQLGFWRNAKEAFTDRNLSLFSYFPD